MDFNQALRRQFPDPNLTGAKVAATPENCISPTRYIVILGGAGGEI